MPYQNTLLFLYLAYYRYISTILTLIMLSALGHTKNTSQTYYKHPLRRNLTRLSSRLRTNPIGQYTPHQTQRQRGIRLRLSKNQYFSPLPICKILRSFMHIHLATAWQYFAKAVNLHLVIVVLDKSATRHPLRLTHTPRLSTYFPQQLHKFSITSFGHIIVTTSQTQALYQTTLSLCFHPCHYLPLT